MGSSLYWILALCLVTAAEGRGTSCGCQIPASCITGVGGSMENVVAMVEDTIGRITGILKLVMSLIPTTTSTTGAPTTAAPTTVVNEATFAETTTVAPTTAAPAADFLTALFNTFNGAESRGDPIKEMVDELTMNGDRHNCFGLVDGVVDSVMGIAGPILGLGEENAERVSEFMKQSVREADKMGLFEAISQIMAVTGMPIPTSCKCDCGCRAAATIPPAAA